MGPECSGAVPWLCSRTLWSDPYEKNSLSLSTLQSLANLPAMNKNLDKEFLLYFYFYFRKFILQPFEQLGQEISNGLSESRCIFSILQKTVGNILKTAVRGWAHSSDYSGGERCTFTASLQRE